MHYSRLILLCLLGFAGATPTIGAQFIPLGSSRNTFSTATGVDANGLAVVGVADFSGVSSAFVWKEGIGMQPFEAANHVITADAISSDGTTVVGRATDVPLFTDQSYIASSSAGFTLIEDGLPNPIGSGAESVSADGKIVVGWSLSNFANFVAYRWTADGGFEPLGSLSGGTPYSIAYGISPDGEVIVGESGSSNGTEAFRWDRANGMVGIGELPGGEWSEGFDVSRNGKVIVGAANSKAQTVEAFRWEQSTGMQGLGSLPGADPNSIAAAVTADGTTIVGNSGLTPDDETAFVWEATHGMRSLQQVLSEIRTLADGLSGWRLAVASDISADGRAIVGWGYNPQGQHEAYLVRLDVPIGVPEPCAHVLLIVGCGFYITMMYCRPRRPCSSG